MQSKVALISDEEDFFKYVSSRLRLRKSDELYRFSFSELPEKLDLLRFSVLIINSEKNKQQTLELLSLLKDSPAIVFAFNEDEEFKMQVLSAGSIGFLTPLTNEDEFKSILSLAFKIVSLLNKNNLYRDMLGRHEIISKYNEVFLNYSEVLDNELNKLNNRASSSVLVAISPNEKSKFLIKANQIETIILSNIRKNDVLMNYAANKYFLLLYDVDVDAARKIWSNIDSIMPEKVYAGFAKTFMKSREQIVNEVLARLHEAINYDKSYQSINSDIVSITSNSNFKLFKQNFHKKFEQVINPTFYAIKQKYSDKLYGVILDIKNDESESSIILKNRYFYSKLTITTPGFTTVNIDIICKKQEKVIDKNRFTFKPEELEIGLLEDLIEQFIIYFKKESEDGNT